MVNVEARDCPALSRALRVALLGDAVAGQLALELMVNVAVIRLSMERSAFPDVAKFEVSMFWAGDVVTHPIGWEIERYKLAVVVVPPFKVEKSPGYPL